MTPNRAKRNPKVPNRFSSDNDRIETSNANGETIIDYNDKSTSTTHNLVPMTRAIKLKPAIREPLKVKLPKLKRLQQQQQHQQQQTTKEHSVNTSLNDIKIHKIKLPSLSSKKSKTTSYDKDSKSKSQNVYNHALAVPKQSNTTNDSQPKSLLAKPSSDLTADIESNQLNYSEISSTRLSNSNSKLDISTSSKSSGGNEHSFSADSSLRTDDSEDTSSRMEIVVSKSENLSSSGIRCPCGVDDDLGVMVECESCSTWQHGHCINVGTEEEAYEGYKCAYCTLPREEFRHSLTQLTVDDKLLERFNVLESLRKQNNSHSYEFLKIACNEKNIKFTVDELNQAVKDLKRVLSSLKVKWRLLTNPAYDLELRIWQNPYWSEEQGANQEQERNLYIGDRCRSNLKLNIRNIVKKMSTRCHLINHALSLVISEGYNQSQDAQIKGSIVQSLELIDREVREFKSKLKNL